VTIKPRQFSHSQKMERALPKLSLIIQNLFGSALTKRLLRRWSNLYVTAPLLFHQLRYSR
jgi:hypothetical protein